MSVAGGEFSEDESGDGAMSLEDRPDMSLEMGLLKKELHESKALNEQLEAERKRKEDLAWHEKAQWAGYGAAVPTAIIILRKLVFKF